MLFFLIIIELAFAHSDLKHLPFKQSKLIYVNITTNNKPNASQQVEYDGMYSPFSVFERNEKDLYYFTQVSIKTKGAKAYYNVILDINLPFTFITMVSLRKASSYTKTKLDPQQQTLINLYLSSKFKQIDSYIHDVYFIIESDFSINSRLYFGYSFFYLIGPGAEIFQLQTNCEGYIGLGFSPDMQYPQLNLIVQLYESNIIHDLTFSTYYGNQPGYIDSVLFLGNYQKIFIDNGNLTAINTFKTANHLWCMNVSNSSIEIQGKIPTYYASQQQTACLDSTFPFIQINQETMNAIVLILEKDKTLKCDFLSFNYENSDHKVLQCLTKLPQFELLKYPILNFSLSSMNGSEFQITLTPQNYIYSCWYDVSDYLKRCVTMLALKNIQLDDNQTLPAQDFRFGLPFMRAYYSFYNLNYQTIYLAKSFEFYLIPQYSTFWYYTLLALLFFWSIVMITCGVYYKEQMNQMMVFVSNIIKYATGDQQARRHLIMGQIMEEQ